MPVVAEDCRGHDRPPRRRSAGDRTRAGPRLASRSRPTRSRQACKGGWAGSVAMAVLACGYGLLKVGSIWYPINLLAAVVYAQSVKLGPAELNAFHLDSFVDRRGRARPHLDARGPALRRDAADVLRGGPSSSADSSRRCCGRALLLLRRWASSIRCWRAASTGSGSWRRRSRSAWSRAWSSFDSSRCRRSRTSRSLLRAGIEAPGTIRPRGEDTVVTHASTSFCLDGSRRAAAARGCGAPPGQPRAGSIALAPNDVVEFGAFYADNCAGCHGANGRGGAAIALANPVYLAIVDERAMRAQHRQRRARHIDACLRAARRRHADREADRCARRRHPIALEPPWSARWRESAFLRCDVGGRHSRVEKPCTRPSANRVTARTVEGGPKGSAITNDSFLALTSDQGLRTIVIAGRPELGAPDWRGNVAGTADVGSGSHRRRELARLAPRGSAGTAVRHHADDQR